MVPARAECLYAYGNSVSSQRVKDAAATLPLQPDFLLELPFLIRYLVVEYKRQIQKEGRGGNGAGRCLRNNEDRGLGCGNEAI